MRTARWMPVWIQKQHLTFRLNYNRDSQTKSRWSSSLSGQTWHSRQFLHLMMFPLRTLWSVWAFQTPDACLEAAEVIKSCTDCVYVRQFFIIIYSDFYSCVFIDKMMSLWGFINALLSLVVIGIIHLAHFYPHHSIKRWLCCGGDICPEPGGLSLLQGPWVHCIHFHLGDSNVFVIPEWSAAACPECLFPSQELLCAERRRLLFSWGSGSVGV